MTDTSSDNPQTNPLELSDEDFLKMNGPVEAEQVEEPVVEEPAPTEDKVEEKAPTEEADPENKVEQKEDSPSGSTEGEDTPAEEPKKEEEKQPENKEAEAAPKTEEEPKTPPNYEEFYQKNSTLVDMIMKPFKANGKTIELKTPEEAIQLMQMGANYTRKMQDIQPHRKVLTMLQNNDLLNEDKLDYLISLDKKDPEAIKKLIKDAGIDPVDIDVSTDSNYLGGNHTVTDEHVQFQTAVEDLVSNDKGRETVQLINSWDDTSKEFFWKNPSAMAEIHAQRESGVFDLIAAEVDRQRTLGNIAQNVPFMTAYTQVGDAMVEAERKSKEGTGQPSGSGEPKPEPKPIETRPANPKPVVKNADDVSAAASPKSAPKPAKVLVNPLEMSDDEFLKTMANRV